MYTAIKKPMSAKYFLKRLCPPGEECLGQREAAEVISHVCLLLSRRIVQRDIAIRLLKRAALIVVGYQSQFNDFCDIGGRGKTNFCRLMKNHG